MPIQSDEDIYKKLKELASKYKIEILTPTASNYTKKEERNSLVSMHVNNSVDNMIGISTTKNPLQNYSFNVIKNRTQCPITEFIKKKDKKGLKDYLDDLDKNIPSIVTVITYKNKFINSFVYVLNNTNRPEEYLEILENSQIFQHCEADNNFWITVAFKADNYQFLSNKVNLTEILEFPLLQEKLTSFSPIRVVEELCKYDEFKQKMEEEFNLLNYVPIMMNSPQLEILEIILNHIKVEQQLNFEDLYIKFDQMNSLDNQENNKYYFNEAMKVFISHAQYKFIEKDTTLKVLTEENKQLIVKNILNKHLHENLTPKMSVKKAKI